MTANDPADARLITRPGARRITVPAMLRTASILTVLFAAGHTLGGLQSWSPAGDTEVLRAMRQFQFEADGVTRTYWEFYIGFGLMISVFLLVQAVMLWQLAAISRKDPLQVRPMLVTILLGCAANGALSLKLFFAVPVLFASIIAATIGLALALTASRAVSR